MSTVYIAHAVGDERGKAFGGSPGDQTGREVLVSPWRRNDKGWIVLRPKDRAVASAIAYDARAAAENPNIGYDQHDRNTLFEAAQKVGYACALVQTPCECDCSSLVRVCLWYAGIKVGHFNTASERDVLMRSGAFIELTDPAYTESSALLMEGDILVTKTKGHTCIVLTDGADAEVTPDPEPEPEPTYTKVVYVKGGSVYVRTVDHVPADKQANKDSIIGTAHRGDKLPYLGKGASGWYKIEFRGVIGYISNKPRYTEVRYEPA